jgi:hypothetical protein
MRTVEEIYAEYPVILATGSSDAMAAWQAELAAAQAGGTVTPSVPTGNGATGSVDQYAALVERQRSNAFDDMASLFSSYGIDVDGSLSGQIKSWVNDDKSASWIRAEFRKTDAYNKRFTGMATLIAKGQAISEAEYIAQERAYANTMRQWDIPKEFLDGPEDFGKLISNGVSVKELDDRIASAKTFLDSRQEYKDAIQAATGASEGALLAYVLDGDRAQSVLVNQFKQAAIGGAGKQYGFDLTGQQVDQYAGTLGNQYNTIGADQLNVIQKQFGQADTMADQDQRLSGIEQDRYLRSDALDATLMNDQGKQLASQQRAQREAARFSGSSAIKTGSLSRKGSL